jgi:benzoate/toluate 1,2-dioxygenase alpha subunit
LNPDVPSLEEYLGEATKIIDMIVGQSEDGLEVLRGASTYTYEGNWKLTAENGADGYHVSAVHWNYAATTQQRKEKQGGDNIRAMSAGLGVNKVVVLTVLKMATCCFGHNGQTQKTVQTSRKKMNTPSVMALQWQNG